MTNANEALLSVRGLTLSVLTPAGRRRVVEDVSFDIPAQTVVAVVGESGSGKSLTALSILRLLPQPTVHLESGEILWRGKNLLTEPEQALQAIRGAEISMIFQEPMTALNPVYTVGTQVAEVLKIHGKARGRAARKRAIELLAQVGIPEPKLRADSYPHELSGGMRQRALIAMALACEPKLLIADEPTTALDVTVQAQILDLLARLQEELHMSTLFITHDLGVVAQAASKVVVMYAGRVVEVAAVDELFARPLHPYSQGLLASIPHARADQTGPRRLQAIPGVVTLDATPACRFANRCARRLVDVASHPLCEQEPALVSFGGQRRARCHYVAGTLAVSVEASS